MVTQLEKISPDLVQVNAHRLVTAALVTPQP